jgi:hypothetical protein
MASGEVTKNQALSQILKELAGQTVKTPARKVVTLAVIASTIYGIHKVNQATGNEALLNKDKKKSSQG